MSGVEVNDFTTPDEVRTPARTTIEIAKIGNGEVGRYTFEPGWRWSECIKPIVGTESCQVEHIGYVVAGSMHIDHAEGSADITEGDVYRIPPGHDAHVVGDVPVTVVEFQGASTFARG